MMLFLIQLEHKGTIINIFDMTRKQSQTCKHLSKKGAFLLTAQRHDAVIRAYDL